MKFNDETSISSKSDLIYKFIHDKINYNKLLFQP